MNNRRTFNLILALILVFLLGGGSSVVLLKTKSLKKVKKDIEKVEKGIKAFGDYHKRLEDLKNRRQRLTMELSKKEKQLFWKKDSSLFIGRITEIAKDLSIEFFTIDSYSIREVVSYPELNLKILEIPIKIGMRVDFFKLINFLKIVENWEKFVKIKDIKIQSGTGEDIYHHRITISLSAYVKETM